MAESKNLMKSRDCACVVRSQTRRGIGNEKKAPTSLRNASKSRGVPSRINSQAVATCTINSRRKTSSSRLTGSARYRAYGRLDVDLSRNGAPAVAYENESILTLVSKRTGCLVLNPFLDLAAVCLK